jgi:hypothetical protein
LPLIYVEILGCLALAFKHKSESKILRAHVAVNFFFFAQILSLLLRRALRLVPVFLICRVWGLLFYPMVFSVPPVPVVFGYGFATLASVVNLSLLVADVDQCPQLQGFML